MKEENQNLTVFGVETFLQVFIDQRSFVLRIKQDQSVNEKSLVEEQGDTCQELKFTLDTVDMNHHLQLVLLLHGQEYGSPHLCLQAEKRIFNQER